MSEVNKAAVQLPVGLKAYWSRNNDGERAGLSQSVTTILSANLLNKGVNDIGYMFLNLQRKLQV